MSLKLALAATIAFLGCSVAAGAQRLASPVSFVDLAYPAEALASREIGVVVVRAATDANGRVTTAEALTGPDTLTRGTLENVKQWTLATKAGTDVLVFRFEIEQARCNDDSRSLFRLVHHNLAVITACTGPDRKHPMWPRDPWILSAERPAPPYPQIAASARVTGVVVLEVWIGADGRVTDAKELTTPIPLLSGAAVADVKTWRAIASPRPPGASTVLVYEFTLGNQPCREDRLSAYEWVLPQYRRLDGCMPLRSGN